MIKFKHISFDLWMTLIKSNPNFKVERDRYFYESHNRLGKSISEISKIIRDIDLMCNEINEINGKSISSEEIYSMVLYKINGRLDNYSLNSIEEIYNEINELFEVYNPTFFDLNTLSVLENLRKKGYTFSLLSNTAFIKGKSLISVLKKLNVFDFFDFLFFSDEYNLSKPNQEFFNSTFYQINNKFKISRNEIVHVGDNYKADYLGSTKFGYHSILINSNDKSIFDLNNL